MKKHQHLRLPLFRDNIERKKQEKVVIKYNYPEERNKARFSQKSHKQAENLCRAFSELKKQLPFKIDPALIFEIEINQSVSLGAFEQDLTSMGIHVLSVAEGKKGFWVVFSEDKDLKIFT